MLTNGILRMDQMMYVVVLYLLIKDGSAIDISNDGSSLSTGSLIKLSSKST